MADFTGMTVKLTMKNPPNLVMHGKVKHVVAGQTLTLQNAPIPQQPVKAPRPAAQEKTPPHPPSVAAPPIQSTKELHPAPAVRIRTGDGNPQWQPSGFVDPAILSYERSPLQTESEAQAPAPSTPIKSILAKAAESLPHNSSPFIAEAGNDSPSRNVAQAKGTPQRVSVARQASNAAQTQNIEADGTQETGQQDAITKKKARRSLKKKPGNVAQDPPQVMNSEVSRNGNDMNGSVRRAKGWRQTPLLQPSPQESSQQENSSSKKKSRKQQDQAREVQRNGWATEDATDIQDLGDFDFEANHKLFDKKQVFDQLRQGDTTADEDRLVSHNKVTRPGTYGGKNLHPTENVLSPQLGPKHHSNELDSTSDADTELNFAANGRSSSRHSTTRTSLKKQPSRQSSIQVEARPHPLSASMSSDRAMNRSVTSLSGRPGRSVPSITTSPRPDRTLSPHSAISTTKTHATPVFASHPMEPHLTVARTMSTCPVLHPAALETLEKETVSRYGFTHDAITESAARCIAEMAMGIFDPHAPSRRGSRANTLRGSMSSALPIDRSSTPVIVIIAGNHSVGARAVAAARHLVGRKTSIIIAEAQYESAETRDVQMKTQLAILKRMAKGGANIKRGPWRRASDYIKKLSGPPAVIIDALLAGSSYDSILDTPNAQHAENASREAREMIEWANRSRAPVLSVGCPSGVSGLDGTTTTVEGEPLAVRPDKVLCLAAPMQGVLDAMKGGERWDVSLADIGINITLKSDEAVAFGAQWVTELRYVEDEVLGHEAQ
ncbi:enhancer of mRNA decapping [Vermiconidia calcicola]|uniref:Enhancer of mRNA decapping n=1 Tax=Vermiconidia calcicola TaxID=1690605 RepID=A0ACC3N8E4_9PEZI|nr:enhancer of mRNA decapping [Vermiconidia calcicola]